MSGYLKICLFLIACLVLLGLFGCSSDEQTSTEPRLRYDTVKKNINVDGDPSDWIGIEQNNVQGPELLWVDAKEGLPAKNWKGNDDLSFCWRSAWYNDKIYFLVEVTDNNPQSCIREYSWLNDCVEIQFDPRNRGGERIESVSADTPIQDRIGKKINGYEMHFLPCSPPRVYLDDTKTVYRLENYQNDIFVNEWAGEIKTRKTANGYLLEIGFRVPGLNLKPGMRMGLDVAVGDDDGNGRKSLMLWTGKQVPFWITMDYYGKLKLTQ